MRNPRNIIKKLALVIGISILLIGLPGRSGAVSSSCCDACMDQMNQCVNTCHGDPDCVWACYDAHNVCGEECWQTSNEHCPIVNGLAF